MLGDAVSSINANTATALPSVAKHTSAPALKHHRPFPKSSPVPTAHPHLVPAIPDPQAFTQAIPPASIRQGPPASPMILRLPRFSTLTNQRSSLACCEDRQPVMVLYCTARRGCDAAMMRCANPTSGVVAWTIRFKPDALCAFECRRLGSNSFRRVNKQYTPSSSPASSETTLDWSLATHSSLRGPVGSDLSGGTVCARVHRPRPNLPVDSRFNGESEPLYTWRRETAEGRTGIYRNRFVSALGCTRSSRYRPPWSRNGTPACQP